MCYFDKMSKNVKTHIQNVLIE